jgi:Guanylate kinase
MEKQDFIKWARKLQHEYVPNETVQQQLQSLDLVAIVGPTGVGKSTIIDKLGIPHILSDVTRLPRPHEEQGKHYYFRSDYMQIIKEIKDGEFVQFLVSASGVLWNARSSIPQTRVLYDGYLRKCYSSFSKTRIP